MNSRPLKLVFDTNVYLAALISTKGYAARFVYESGIGLRYQVYASVDILAEFKSKVIDKKPNLLEDAEKLITFILKTAELTNSKHKLSVLIDEPDNRVLECAVSAKADLVATFDKEFLKLKSYEGIGIIHPSQLQDYFPR
jgi:uncharacterized protein